MSDIELSREQELTREEAAERLRSFADALADGGHVEIDLGGGTLKVHVPERIRAELEIEVDGDEVELELELKWSTRTEPKPRSGRRRATATAEPAEEGGS